MIKKDILQKVRKCLALGSSSNENEAAAALSKAARLMEEHGITQAMLDMADIEEATSRSSRTVRPPQWESYLCAAVSRALNVHSFINEIGDRTFVGRGANPEIAAYAYGVLFRQLKRARKDYISLRLKRCKIANKRRRADVFCEGWALAVYRKIEALVPERKADDAISQYLVERYPSLRTIGSRSANLAGGRAAEDFFSGKSSGSKAQLHNGVQANGERLAIA